MNEIVYQTVLGFSSQLAFLWARTYNVHANASLDVKATVMSGAVIHLLWLVGIAVGSASAFKILVEGDMLYIPVVIGTLSGSILGTYIGLKGRIKAVNKKPLNNCAFIEPIDNESIYVMGIDTSNQPNDYSSIHVMRRQNGHDVIVESVVMKLGDGKNADKFERTIQKFVDKYGSMPIV